jgi:hypothetical protein
MSLSTLIAAAVMACAAALGVVLLLFMAGESSALASVPLVGRSIVSTPAGDPKASIPPVPDFGAACSSPPPDDSQPCLAVTEAAIDRARRAEGLGPLSLPAGFASMPVPQQVMAVFNAERSSRHLAPIELASPTLSRLALFGALADGDPSTSPPSFVRANGVWAGGIPNVPAADYYFLYDDGPGGLNPDCAASGAVGCWEHRDAILEDYGRGTTLAVGAAFVLHDPAGFGSSFAAELAVDPRGSDG